ncbi:O-antigen translocase [Stutzerimonas kunmingensis]|uniref:O-antigen translocase n=1 Tax=Stutzerimonas kunmingensis TaxID=1211807 RepID=UPI002481FA25|nr:O-antigen translocase [Stutzerimonas kunmingensis]
MTIFIRILAGLLVIKVLAWSLGPEGFGLFGQLMALVAIAGMLAGGGVSNGLIKVLAKAPVTEPEGKAWFASAATLSVLISAGAALLLCAFSGVLSEYFMPSVGALLFVTLGFSQMIVAVGNLPLAEASSRGDTRTYALINIIGTVLGSGLIVLAALAVGFVGAAYAVAIMPAMVGVAALVYLVTRRRELFACSYWLFASARMKHLMMFSLVTLIGALSVPLAQMFIRDVIGRTLGWEQAGLWQGVVKLSDVYMQFVGVMLLHFVMPRYSAASDKKRLFNEWLISVSVLVAVLLIGFIVFYFLRNFIVSLIFSNAFLPMKQLLAPQMAGDVARTVAASISYIFMARGAVHVSIVFELLQGLILVCAFNIMFGSEGVMAPVYAHLFTYLSLTLVMAFGLFFWMKRSAS